MADTNVVAPQNDNGFMSASPEDRHAYLTATDHDYASASPEDQQAYMGHVVNEGAKLRVAQYPENTSKTGTPQDMTVEQFSAQPESVQHAQEQAHRSNLLQDTAAALPESVVSGMGAIEKHVNEPLNRMSEAGAKFGRQMGADYVAGASGGASGYSAVPRMTPLTSEQSEKQNPAVTGVARAIGGFVGGQVSDPRQVALLVGSMGSREALPVLNKVISGAFATQMGAGAIQKAKELGAKWDTLTPPEKWEGVTNLGIQHLFAGLAGGHAAGEPVRAVGGAVKPMVAPAVRMAGHALEGATSPVVAGGAAGSAIGRMAGIPHGVSEAGGSALASSIAQGMGKNPITPMMRFPRMTQFGVEPVYPGAHLPTYNPGAPLPEFAQFPGAPLPAEPTPQQLAPNALGKLPVTDAKPSGATGEALGAPKESPQVPKPEEKNLGTLKSAYDKANKDYQKAYEARQAYAASEAQGVKPPEAVQKSFEKAEKALDEAQFHYQTALEAGQPKVEDLGTGTNQPAPKTEPKTELLPQPVMRRGQQELPGGGVMGKPLQLPAAPEPTPEATAVPETPVETPRMGEKAPAMVRRIRDLTEQGLGGKALERNKPIREQNVNLSKEAPVPLPSINEPVEKVKGEVLPPEKPQVSQTQVALDKAFGEDTGEEKIIEGETEHSVPQVRANGEVLANAIPKTPEGHDLLQKLHDLSNVELRQLAINAGEDMGQQQIGRGKASGNVTRPEVFERMLKNHSAEDLGKMVDEGKHLPEASGGSQGAAAAPEPYTGPERRTTERKAPLNAVELEEAIKGRKTMETPFDVTEGAKATIERDKMMPQHPSEPSNPVSKELNSYNKSVGVEKPDQTKVVKDPRAVEIADAYDAMKHDPENPAVKKSYDSLKKEVKDQWDYLKSKGYTLEGSDKDPYDSFDKVSDDVKKNKYLSIFRGGNPLEKGHPLAEVDPDTRESYNTMLRGIHDVMGHVAGDNDFSERGEENAFNLHRQSFSKEAVPALTTETKGQTSWFFNNKDVRGGKTPGEFGEQKAGLLPKEFYEEGPNRLSEKEAKAVVDHLKSGKDFSVLQAENPQNNRISDAKNAELTSKLYNELKEKGYKPVAVGGNTKDVQGTTEHAFFVPDMKPEDAVKFGKKYEQQGILTAKGLHDLNTDAINPIKKGKSLLTGDKAREQQYFTTVGNEDFNVPLDFDKRVNMRGSPVDEFGNPTVSGGNLSKSEAKRLAEEHLTDEEKAGVTKTEKGNNAFINKLMSMPAIREVTDIAKSGEGAREWYQRSQKALENISQAAPRYFNSTGDLEKFTGLLAASSPRQSVAMNIREALNAWKNYVDEGRPEGNELKKLLTDNFVNSGGKVPNAMKALAGDPMWPDLTKNRAFKVPSFRDNLSGMLNRVTNDGWMALFAGLDAKEIEHPTSYHPISVITREAAKQLGWEPAEAQAAIWSFVKTFHDKQGVHVPADIRHYSEDMADIVKHDPQTRDLLSQLGVNLDDLDKRIESIGPKPEVTSGDRSTTASSIRKLGKRIKNARGEAPTPKDSGLFDRQDEQGDTSFNPDELTKNAEVKKKK